jgi:hypothetical protein
MAIPFYSQNNKVIEHLTFSMNFKLPKTILNHSFKNMIFGVANIDAQLQYEFLEKFELGIGYKYGYYDVNSLAFQTKVNGQMENHNPFVKIGVKNSINENIFMNLCLKGGYNYGFTKINTCNENYLQNSFRLEPEFSIWMYSNENLAFGLLLSYNFWFSEFTPENFCMSNFPGMNPINSDGIYQVFCVGFGFYTHFPQKQQY